MSTTNASEKNAPEKNMDDLEKKLDTMNIDNKDENSGPRRNSRPSVRRGTRGGFRGGRGGRGAKFMPYEERLRLMEEEQLTKKILEAGVRGHVKWFSVQGRYGFIEREDGGDDVFVHQAAINKSSTVKVYLRTLDDTEEVLFDVVEGRKGPEAANVSGPNGDNVRGSKYAKFLLYRFRQPNNNRRKGAENGDRNEEEGERDHDAEDDKNEEGDGRTQRRSEGRSFRGRRARGRLHARPANEGERVMGQEKDEQPGEEGAEAKNNGGEKKAKKPRRKSARNDNSESARNGNSESAQETGDGNKDAPAGENEKRGEKKRRSFKKNKDRNENEVENGAGDAKKVEEQVAA